MQSAFHNLPTISGVMQHDGVKFQGPQTASSTPTTITLLTHSILLKAYPKEAGVRSRGYGQLRLDRKANKITVEENFSNWKARC